MKKKRTKKNPSPGVQSGGVHASAAHRRAAAAALQKARAWYGNDALVTEPKPLKAYQIPEAVVEIGRIVAIEYESDKYDGETRVWRHEVTKTRKLYVSIDGGTLIVSPGFKITKRGIEG